MTLVIESRRDITLAAYERVAWQGARVRLHETAKTVMAEARAGFLALLDSNPELVVYGVTSGYGQMAHLRFTPEDRRRHARRPPTPPMTSFGEPLPDRVTRGMVLARLTNFVEGHGALSPELGAAVAALLDGPPLPPVPALGNGCPGEIQALSHLLSPLAQRFELGEKDSIALVNGSPCATALLADATLAARRRLALAVEVFALSIEALNAPLEHYDEALEGLWDDPHEAAMLRALRGWLDGAAAARRPYQAPVSWRILPRVLGYAGRVLAGAEEAAEISLGAVSDTPVYLMPDAAHPLGRVLSNGGFHNAKAYPLLDDLAAAWADLALLTDRHVTKLMDGRTSLLPDYLMGPEGGYPGCLGFSAAAFAEQARQAAARSVLPGSEGGGFGQNDVAVPTFLSWRREAEAGSCLEAGLAVLAAVASQALHVTERDPAPPLKPLLEAVRAEVPPIQAHRGTGPEVERLQAVFYGRVFGDVRAAASPA